MRKGTGTPARPRPLPLSAAVGGPRVRARVWAARPAPSLGLRPKAALLAAPQVDLGLSCAQNRRSRSLESGKESGRPRPTLRNPRCRVFPSPALVSHSASTLPAAPLGPRESRGVGDAPPPTSRAGASGRLGRAGPSGLRGAAQILGGWGGGGGWSPPRLSGPPCGRSGRHRAKAGGSALLGKRPWARTPHLEKMVVSPGGSVPSHVWPALLLPEVTTTQRPSSGPEGT